MLLKTGGGVFDVFAFAQLSGRGSVELVEIKLIIPLKLNKVFRCGWCSSLWCVESCRQQWGTVGLFACVS